MTLKFQSIFMAQEGELPEVSLAGSLDCPFTPGQVVADIPLGGFLRLSM